MGPRDERRRRIRYAALVLLAFAFGCDGGRPDILIDLQTDLRAEFEFQQVSVRITDGPGAPRSDWSQVRTVTRDEVFVPGGQRVAEFLDLAPGDYVVEVQLLGEGLDLAPQTFTFALDSSALKTARFSRACIGVRCPLAGDSADATLCIGDGRCVTPECTPGECPGDCRGDIDCGGGSGCLRARCVEGACLDLPDDGACASDAYCDGETRACAVLPATPDAGPGDAGLADGGLADGGPSDSGAADTGPMCTPGGCNDGDPCTDDLCSGGVCINPPRCRGNTYCLAGSCFPEPSIEFLTTSTAGCIDLGVAHPSGDDFTFRRVTSGRPNAGVQQINEHISCGLPRENAEVYTLDGSGNETFSFYSAAVSDCFASIYGRYRISAQIDGRESPADLVTYFNSTCPGISTCAAARFYCSPCVACSGSEYCAGDDGCAPNPTLAITSSEGGGCVDLATPTTLTVDITGRPNATSTQYNHHVSCGTPEAAAEERVLDSTGAGGEVLPLGALPDCEATIYGRYDVEVEVDGQRSNTVEVVYYNSDCPGIATCTAARTACVGG